MVFSTFNVRMLVPELWVCCSLRWLGCLCSGCGLFSFVILGCLCPGCGRGFGLSFARGVGLVFFVRLPVCLYVGSRWLLVIFSVVVVAVSSFWGGGEGFPLVYHFPVNYIPSNFKLKQILCYKCC